jgi:hypothetical protein
MPGENEAGCASHQFRTYTPGGQFTDAIVPAPVSATHSRNGSK